MCAHNRSNEFSEILESVDSYYTAKIQQHGLCAQGVDWNSEESQMIRFSKLSNIISSDEAFSINDLGCGYGSFVGFLDGHDFDYDYKGYDISAEMVSTAKKHWAGKRSGKVSFFEGHEMSEADYTIASGIFNVKGNVSNDKWLSYVLDTLSEMHEKSTKGFSFNMLTKYSDPPYMQSSLWYANPAFIFDYCMQQFSRSVSLIHDYELYEFTVLVRKGRPC